MDKDYLCRNQYPKVISKGNKAKCKNFKFDCGVLYFKRVKKGREGDETGGRVVLEPKTKKKKHSRVIPCWD